MLSGVTDCYQPAEKEFRITRSLLDVALAAGQPLCVITKNARIVRDLDLLIELAKRNLVHVSLSITTLDTELARQMEPRTSTPAARLRALRELSQAGVPTRVMTAPVIPSLNDAEIPALLKAAAEAGAQSAGWVLLRLPFSVKPVFLEWLERVRPLARDRIEQAIRETRGGELYSSQWRERQTGKGLLAEQIGAIFRTFAKRCGLDRPSPVLDTTQFRPPASPSGQLWLF
jgi:DNA repair photolyase